MEQVSFRENYETSHEYHYHLMHFQEYLEKSFQNATIKMPKRNWLDTMDSSGCIHSNLIFSVNLEYDVFHKKYRVRFIPYPMKSSKSSSNSLKSSNSSPVSISPQFTALKKLMDLENIPLYLEECKTIRNGYLDDDYILETKSCIPLRWLYIFKDFFEPAYENGIVSMKETPEWYPMLKKLEPVKLRELIYNVESISGYFKVFKGPDGKYWETSNIYLKDWSPISKWVISETGSFECLGGSQYGYRQLPSPEGGLIIDNPYVRIWMNFQHRIKNESGGSYRPYCKGYQSYSTGKDITMEELRIMYMIFEKLGCELSQFYYGKV
jgi:hypothetical protein